MKVSPKRFGIGIVLSAIGVRNATLKINHNMHYFANGILTGIGLTLIAREVAKMNACEEEEEE